MLSKQAAIFEDTGMDLVLCSRLGDAWCNGSIRDLKGKLERW